MFCFRSCVPRIPSVSLQTIFFVSEPLARCSQSLGEDKDHIWSSRHVHTTLPLSSVLWNVIIIYNYDLLATGPTPLNIQVYAAEKEAWQGEA
jgi:hypothetical protein